MGQSRTRRWQRVSRLIAVPLLAAGVVAFVPFGLRGPQPAEAAWTPMSPVRVTFDQPGLHGRTATARMLAFNDFHGNIDPPTGSSGLINGTPAGGVEYLATWVKRLRAQALQQTREVFTVAAGDLIGASPLVSAAFHDEPAIEEMNALGLQLSSVGNHEFDEGVTELKRMQFGGCHPTVGFQLVPPPALPDPSSCANFAGAITPIVAGLRPEYGLVISAHTHQFYTCALPNSSGANSVVTSASSFGRLVTDVSVTVDRHTRQFTEIAAHNVIVENGVKLPDGSWAKDAAGNFIRNPDLVDPAAKAIADKYRTAVAPIANRVVGSITADIVQAAQPNGESPLGDVIADAQLAYTKQAAGAQIALMNPGGIRTSLIFANSPAGEAPGEVTFGECFAVQPFNNLVVTQTFTGAQLKNVLEQQFVGFGGQTVQRILQVSAGFTYSYDSTQPAGQNVSNMALNGTPIDPAASYRVTTNDFLANGGDGFTNLRVGTARATAPGFDVDALVAYLGANSPVPPGPANRIQKVA